MEKCKRGHDTSICGRDDSGGCKDCKREYEKRPDVIAKRRERDKLPGRKALASAAMKKWFAKPEVKKARQLYSKRPEIKARLKTPLYRFTRCQGDAAQRGLPFELNLEQFTNLIIQDCIWKCSECDITGIDRIDSSAGYTLQNCQPMCHNHNIVKNEFTMAQLKILVSAMEKT